MRRTALGLAIALVGLPIADVAAQTTVQPLDGAQELPQLREAGPSTISRIASAFGSAILGAGLGFFASQLVQGDWDEAGGQEAINRSVWAVVGGSVGLTVGVRYPVFGRSGALGSGGLPGGRSHLAAAELEGSGIHDAYDAVASLRPEWLRIRGNRSLVAGVDPVQVDGTGAGTQVSGSTPLISEAGTIQVYVDGVNVGGIDALHTINMMTIQDMYFFDAAAATLRWGEGNPHGAILVVS